MCFDLLTQVVPVCTRENRHVLPTYLFPWLNEGQSLYWRGTVVERRTKPGLMKCGSQTKKKKKKKKKKTIRKCLLN